MAQTLRQPGDQRPGERRGETPGSDVPGDGQAEPAGPGPGPAAAGGPAGAARGPAGAARGPAGAARGPAGTGGPAGAAGPAAAGGAVAGWRPPVGPARISAVSGIVFAVLFAAAIVLIAQGPRLHDPDPVFQAFYAGGGHLIAVAGLNVVPFAGIAFLYHLAANRALYRGCPASRRCRRGCCRSPPAWCSSA